MANFTRHKTTNKNCSSEGIHFKVIVLFGGEGLQDPIFPVIHGPYLPTFFFFRYDSNYTRLITSRLLVEGHDRS